MKTIYASEWTEGERVASAESRQTSDVVRDIIEAVRLRGDSALREFAARFDRSSPEKLEVPLEHAQKALREEELSHPELFDALRLAVANAEKFAAAQRAQFQDFEFEIESGLFTGQRILPVEKAAVYIPAGRFPLFSSVIMGAIPAKAAGVKELIVLSPPLEDGLPDTRILALAAMVGVNRIFAVGGAQAIAAAAYGTESIPRVDVIVGPGSKFIAEAKKQVYGQVGIDFIAGPTDVLVLADGAARLDLIAADMLAQAEHDPDARARVLLPSVEMARQLQIELERQLNALSNPQNAKASLDAGGLLVIYKDLDEAIRVADAIAPEHLELHCHEARSIAPRFSNYGSLFIGSMAAEVLGDYSAGINHTLPTSGTARFTGGLSVRHFLKTQTTLYCEDGAGYRAACEAAEIIGRAEGLDAHADGAKLRYR